MRGLRLCQVREDLIDTQLQALAAAHKATGAELWVMAPMVSTADEAKWFADKARGYGLPKVGIMIEVPAAALRAEQLLSIVDFASIGTNDLTQTTFGFSRDDVEAEFVPQYLAERLLPYNPFATIDPGVAKLVEMGVELGHKGNPDLVCGVCGEHGGDPDSVKTFHTIGLDYVSCSPYRVPLARLAAGQAALAEKMGDGRDK